MAHEYGVKEIKLNAFIPTGTGSHLDQSHSLSPQTNKLVSSELLILSQKYPSIHVVAGAFFKEVKWHAKGTSSSSTFGCGASTTSLVINSDFSLSACDMLTEKDRTQPINTAEDIQKFWDEDPIFLKWRGQLLTIDGDDSRSFSEVHQHGCHLAYSVYGENIFE